MDRQYVMPGRKFWPPRHKFYVFLFRTEQTMFMEDTTVLHFPLLRNTHMFFEPTFGVNTFYPIRILLFGIHTRKPGNLITIWITSTSRRKTFLRQTSVPVRLCTQNFFPLLALASCFTGRHGAEPYLQGMGTGCSFVNSVYSNECFCARAIKTAWSRCVSTAVRLESAKCSPPASESLGYHQISCQPPPRGNLSVWNLKSDIIFSTNALPGHHHGPMPSTPQLCLAVTHPYIHSDRQVAKYP